MRRRLARACVAVALSAGAAGCAGPLARAEAQFADGMYPDAERSLRSLEAESRAWSDPSRAEYALYRGLTLLALGDRERGARWLREARAIDVAHPGSLRPADARRLETSLESAGDAAE